VRGEPIWTHREHVVVLIDDGRRRRCSGGNQRGGGVFGGRSQRGGRVGSGEGGELKLGRGCETEWSEVPATSSNRRARGGEREREMEGGQLCAAWRKGNERERERAPTVAVDSVG
jgi:hypothetical protein